MKQEATSKQTPQDYERLGRQIEATYLSGSLDRRRLLTNSFIKGIAAGSGSVIGATLVIAMLLWVLTQLQEIPLVGPLFQSIERTIENQ